MSEALEWKPTSGLAHVTACATCREELAAIEALGEVVGERVTPEPGFTERIMGALPVADAEAVGESALRRPPTVPRGARSAAAALTGMAAAIGVFFGVLFVGSAGGGPPPGAPLILASLLAGAVVSARDLRKPLALEKLVP